MFDDPRFWRTFHKWATIVFLVAMPISYVLRESLVWIVMMSHYAIIVSHWSGWQGARAEVESAENPPKKGAAGR